MYYLHMFYIHAHTPVYLQNAAKISKITSNLPRLLKKKKSIHLKSKETTRKTVMIEARTGPTNAHAWYSHAFDLIETQRGVMHAHPFIRTNCRKQTCARGNGTQRNVEPFHEYSGLSKAHRESRVTLE